MNWLLSLFLLLGQPVLAQQRAAESPPAVQTLLKKLDQAQASLSYQGAVVFQHRNRLETFLLKRSADPVEGGEYLISTNGPVRELLRRDQWLRCVLPENGDSLVDARLMHGLFPQLDSTVAKNSAPVYHWEVLGKNRIGNRPAWQLRAQARDDLRYSHVFWLDAQWGALLGYAMLGKDNKPLEQTLFVDFKVEEHLKLPPGHLLGKQHLSVQAASEEQLQTGAQAPWKIDAPPAGFHLSGLNRVVLPDGQYQWQLRYSDGLSQVTVYVEPASEQPLQGAFQMGAMNAHGRITEQGLQVVVMGSVPVKTLQLFSSRLVPSSPDPS